MQGDGSPRVAQGISVELLKGTMSVTEGWVKLDPSGFGGDTRMSVLPERPRLAKEPRKGQPGDGDRGGSGTAVITKTRTQTKKPNMYRVLLLNDDYTPMEFVVLVLQRFFNKGPDEATRIMLHVHNHGVGECGVFTYEVAETKVTQVMDHARKHQHPLQCIMEKK
jgi:ATP-dependent Clp protease adaptor protein ClpS